MALNQEAYRSGSLGYMAPQARAFRDGSLGQPLVPMDGFRQPREFRDGALGFAQPREFRDGSLGILGQPPAESFRDGVLGGAMLGVLGEEPAPSETAQPVPEISAGPAAAPPMWKSLAAMALIGAGAWWLSKRKKPLFASNPRRRSRRRRRR